MPDAVQSRDDALRSPARRRVADALAQEKNGLDAHQIADAIGLHVTTVRWHLERLEAAGYVASRSERAGGAGRPRKVYTVVEQTDKPDAERDRRSLELLGGLLTQMVSTQDERPVSPEEAGEKWASEHVHTSSSTEPAQTPGEWISKIGGLTDVLNSWGYTPAISTNGDGQRADIRLAHCPFRELARDNPAVVCGIHRGLIRGTMRKLGETDTEVDLLPFADGDTCIAHLTHHPSSTEAQTPGTTAKES